VGSSSQKTGVPPTDYGKSGEDLGRETEKKPTNFYHNTDHSMTHQNENYNRKRNYYAWDENKKKP